MILKSVLAGTFKLDGGAMFGVVPKKIWSKMLACDDQNLCTWAMRCLYIEADGKKILIDTGLGTKQDAKFFSYYSPQGHQAIQDALIFAGIDADEITDIILTHLHFDHAGGAIMRTQRDGQLTGVFPKARHWVHQEQWALANHPNPREKASFLKENILPLEPYLNWIDPSIRQFSFIEFIKVDGHTQGMILPLITMENGKKLLYCADLFPSLHHLPIHYVIAYDMQPLVTMQEKEAVLRRAVAESIDYFFEHDEINEIAQIGINEQGKFYPVRVMTLSAWLQDND